MSNVPNKKKIIAISRRHPPHSHQRNVGRKFSVKTFIHSLNMNTLSCWLAPTGWLAGWLADWLNDWLGNTPVHRLVSNVLTSTLTELSTDLTYANMNHEPVARCTAVSQSVGVVKQGESPSTTARYQRRTVGAEQTGKSIFGCFSFEREDLLYYDEDVWRLTTNDDDDFCTLNQLVLYEWRKNENFESARLLEEFINYRLCNINMFGNIIRYDGYFQKRGEFHSRWFISLKVLRPS